MIGVLNTVGMGLKDAVLVAWEVWWALVFGFAISAIVQAWVPRERIESALSGSGVSSLAKATGLGAASNSRVLTGASRDAAWVREALTPASRRNGEAPS